MLPSLTPLSHVQPCAVAMARAARASSAAARLASRATIACSPSRVQETAVAVANAQRVAPVHVTMVGEALTAAWIFPVLGHLQSASGMASVSAMGSASVSLGTTGMIVQLGMLYALETAQATAIAAPLHSASATKASAASIAARCCSVSRKYKSNLALQLATIRQRI